MAPPTPAEQILAAYEALAAHGIRLDGHDQTPEQMRALAAIASGDVAPSAVLSEPAVRAVA